MSATVNNPGSISASSSPSDSTSFVNGLLAAPLETWPVAWLTALREYLKRLPQGDLGSATVASLLGVVASTEGSVSTSGTKTCQVSLSPSLTASTLTTLLSIPPQSMTITQLGQIVDALKRVPGGGTPGTLIGSLLR